MRILTVLSLIAYLSVGGAPPASASDGYWRDGNSLLDDCSNNVLGAFGYIEAFVDTEKHIGASELEYCIPDGVKAGQIKDVVCNYLTSKPGNRHYIAPVLVREALSKTWPCSK